MSGHTCATAFCIALVSLIGCTPAVQYENLRYRGYEDGYAEGYKDCAQESARKRDEASLKAVEGEKRAYENGFRDGYAKGRDEAERVFRETQARTARPRQISPQEHNASIRRIIQKELDKSAFETVLREAIENLTALARADMQAEFGRELTYTENQILETVFAKTVKRVFSREFFVGQLFELYRTGLEPNVAFSVLEFYETPAGKDYLNFQAMLQREGLEQIRYAFEAKQEEFFLVLFQEFIKTLE